MKQKAKNKDKSSFEFARQFGTYEIQKTADTENEFPKIAQGLMQKDKNPKNKKN